MKSRFIKFGILVIIVIISIILFILSKGNETRGVLVCFPIIAMVFLWTPWDNYDDGHGGYA